MRLLQKIRSLFFIALATLGLSACAQGPCGNPAVPEPAKPVQLEKYLGRWYEIARYEAWFERGCLGTTADYSLRPDGKIRVLNACHRENLESHLDTAEGTAYVVEGSQNAKLRVAFFWPFYGDYWVLDHAEDYSWSIVGEPSGRYLWFLFRESNPEASLKSLVASRAQQMGYDLGLLRWER